MIAKRKHNRGRLVPERWIFGGVESPVQGRQSRGFLVEVPDRRRDTLWPIIQQYIHPGSIVVSDCWSAYVTDPDGPRERRHIAEIPVNPPYIHQFVSKLIHIKNSDI